MKCKQANSDTTKMIGLLNRNSILYYLIHNYYLIMFFFTVYPL